MVVDSKIDFLTLNRRSRPGVGPRNWNSTWNFRTWKLELQLHVKKMSAFPRSTKKLDNFEFLCFSKMLFEISKSKINIYLTFDVVRRNAKAIKSEQGSPFTKT